MIDLGEYAVAQEQLANVFAVSKAEGHWWDPEAEERTKQYWRMVTSEDIPD